SSESIAVQQYSPRSSPHSDSTVPRSPAKPATSCPDLPVGPQVSEYYSHVLAPIGTYSGLNKNQRTSWKNRLFNSNPKKQDRRASTNSNVDDDYEWSSNQETDTSSGSSSNSAASATSTSPSTTPAAGATSTEKQTTRPRMRISPPLTQPILPANQKTVPIMQNPLKSPTDDHFGPDTFDPFKVAPKSKSAAPSGPVSMMMMMTTPADEVVLPSADSSSPSEQSGRPTVDTHIKPPATLAHQMLTPPSSHSSEDSFPFASPTSSSSSEDDREESAAAPSEANGGKASAVLDFAASLCEGLVSDFVMPPSYFDQHSLSLAFEDAYPRADPDMMPKVTTASSPPSSPPSPRSPVSFRSSRSKISLRDRSLKSSSTYSTDSDSSTSSIESEEEESSDDDSSLSPISGVSFFSTMPPTTGHSFKPHRSTALIKSGGIKIPSSLMTLLPTGSSNKSKAIPVSPSTTPPVSPPLAHAEIVSSQMASLAPGVIGGQTPPGMIMALADPRAMMLKRLAYIHTLRKLRERERRPFRHAVLLHLILLQLRRGITNKHCSEIAEFYVTMSVAQFPPRLDIANTMIMAQQQRSKSQQQQQVLSQQTPISQIPVLASPIESVQESMIPVRSSSKAASIPTLTSGDKEPKSRRSLVFSLQSRNQANKAQNSSNNNGESGWSLNSTTTAPAAAAPAPSQISVFKERLPLLRIPTYPLINLEKNSHNNNNNNINNPVLTSSTSRKNLAAAVVDSSEEDQGIEESNVDFQPGMVAQPVPSIIRPKRTTGRKGLLYQQQLQLRMRQQLEMTMGGNSGGADLTLTPGMSEQDQACHRGPASITTTTSTTTSATSTGATSPAHQDGGNSSLPAGLLTPPLSPLFRNPFSAATSNPTAASTTPASTGSINNTTSNNNSSNLNSSLPPPLPPTTTPPTNNNVRSSYAAHGHHSPPSSSTAAFPSHHTRVLSAGSVSSYTLPHMQNSHHTIGYLEGQAVHARSRSSLEGNPSGRGPSPPPLPPSTLSRKSSSTHQQQQQQQLGLPSPPLSPTLDAEGHSAAAMLSTVSASMNPSVQSVRKGNLPQRSLSSGGYSHVQLHGMLAFNGSANGAAANGVVGARSENIAWIMRAPSPIHQHHDLQARQSMEDMRNRVRHWKSSSSSTSSTSSSSSSSSGSVATSSSPLAVSASAVAASTTAVSVGGSGEPKASKKSSSVAKGVGAGIFSPEESEEEDVPLAFVQRRISSDTLRSMA
ncbi:hypothetical protein BGZ96_001459, partial [Linnemannia gamsii]